MARPIRIEYEGAIYHVTSRGNERKKIFFGETDYDKFRAYLREGQDKFGYLVHCYVLMTNHYHLVIQTPHGNLSELMHYVNGSYTNYINRKNGRQGHLLQGRYKAILIDCDAYLLQVSRYLHLNPVRAGLVAKPEEYPYSSYRSYVSSHKEDFVYRNLIWEMIANNHKGGPKGYRQFVEKVIGEEGESPLKNIYGGVILGKETFINEVLARLRDDTLKSEEITHRKKLRGTMNSEAVINAIALYFKVPGEAVRENKKPYRKIAVYLLKQYTGLTNREIMELFGRVSYSAIAKAYERFRGDLMKDKALQKEVEAITSSLSNVKG